MKWLALVSAGLVLTACGHGSPADSSKAQDNSSLFSTAADGSPSPAAALAPVAGLQGFVHGETGRVDYLQWTGTSGTVHGTWIANSLTGMPPNQRIESTTDDFTMTIDGETISMNAFGTPSFGTLHGDTLTINLAQKDGTLAATRWARATPDEYNSALQLLQGRVGDGNAQQGHANDVAAAEKALGDATNGLVSAIAELRHSTSSLAADLEAVDRDTATTISDADAVAKEQRQGVDNATVCGDANGVIGDANGVQGDANGIAGDGNGVSGSAERVRNASGVVWSSLDAVLAVEPGFTGTAHASGPDGVAAIRMTATQAIASVLKTMNAGIDHANGRVAVASAAAVRAVKAGGCGNSPETPAPIPHVH